MQLWELMLIAVALSMDAFAVGMTDGMEEPNMPAPKKAAVAVAFGVFQALMPLLGYYASSAFSSLVERIAPWLSFALLAFIGGKAIFSCIMEERRGGLLKRAARARLTPAKLFAQAVATSLDALAVGVTLLASEATVGLPFHVALCALLIGLTTFVLSAVAVEAGERVGNRLADRAELLGGGVLILIGLKILFEGVA